MENKEKICSNKESKIKDYKSLTNLVPDGNKRYKKTWKDFVCESSEGSVRKTKKKWELLDFCKFFNEKDNLDNYGIIVDLLEKIALHKLKIGMLVTLENEKTQKKELGMVIDVHANLSIRTESGEIYQFNKPYPDDIITALPFDDRRWIYIDKTNVKGPYTDEEIELLSKKLDEKTMLKTIYDDTFFSLKKIRSNYEKSAINIFKDYAEKNKLDELNRTKDLIVSIYNSKEIVDINFSNIKFGSKKKYLLVSNLQYGFIFYQLFISFLYFCFPVSPSCTGTCKY